MTPPSTAHVRVYKVVRDGEPSSGQPATSDRKEVPQLSPSDPHLDERTPHQFQMDLGDLWDAQLRQLMEDLYHRELNVPPRDPPSGHWGTPAGHGNPNVDDQEVTFLSVGGWEPQGQPPQPTALLNQMKM